MVGVDVVGVGVGVGVGGEHDLRGRPEPWTWTCTYPTENNLLLTSSTFPACDSTYIDSKSKANFT